MKYYYTVDRSNLLKARQILNTNTDYSNNAFYPVQDLFTQDDLSYLINDLYPNGLTNHGKRYLLDEFLIIQSPQGTAPLVPHMPMIELIVELIRRNEFPEKISRFQAIFGWETIEEARTFQNQPGNNNSTIWKVQCHDISKHDMSLLLLGGSTVGSIMFARKYWQGDSGNNPKWEILMKPPVEVLKIAQ